MVQIAGKYKLVKSENLLEYFTAAGIPVQLAQIIDAPGTTTEITVNENKYSIDSSAGINVSFTLDQEFVEPFPGTQSTLKSKARKEGDVIIINSTANDGKIGERKYEFLDDGYVVYLTAKNVTAIRHFTRI